MSSFAEGMRIGQGLVDAQQAREQRDKENARNERLDAQRAESHALGVERANLEIGGLNRVNEATDNLTALSRVGARDEANWKNNNDEFEAASNAALRPKLTEGQLAQQAALVEKGLPSAKGYFRDATDKDYNGALTRLASAKGDIDQLGKLRIAGQDIDWKIGSLKHGGAWDALTDAERTTLIKKHSDDLGVPGTGNWIAGTGKSAGYMNYLPPKGDPIKLSASDARQVYILSNMMHENPTRARAELKTASDGVAAAARHLFEDQTKAAAANNSGSYQQAHAATSARMADTAALAQKDLASYHTAGLKLQGENTPRPLSAAAQTDLQALYDKMGSAKTHEERDKLNERFNARLAMEQAFGRGGRVSFLPRNAAEPKQQISFKDFMDVAGGSLVPATSAGGKSVKLSELPAGAQIAAWRAAIGSDGGATPSGLPTTGGPESKGATAAPSQGSDTPQQRSFPVNAFVRPGSPLGTLMDPTTALPSSALGLRNTFVRQGSPLDWLTNPQTP
jgi:hypothetical protein